MPYAAIINEIGLDWWRHLPALHLLPHGGLGKPSDMIQSIYAIPGLLFYLCFSGRLVSASNFLAFCSNFVCDLTPSHPLGRGDHLAGSWLERCKIDRRLVSSNARPRFTTLKTVLPAPYSLIDPSLFIWNTFRIIKYQAGHVSPCCELASNTFSDLQLVSTY